MEIIQIFQGLLTPLIAVIAIYIAYQQLQLNRFNTRKELYDRRMKIFKAVIEFINIVFKTGEVKLGDLGKLLYDTNENSFLFKKDIKDYIDQLYKNGVDLMVANEKYDRIVKKEETIEKFESFIDNKEKLFEWFTKQYENAVNIFKSYLTLNK